MKWLTIKDEFREGYYSYFLYDALNNKTQEQSFIYIRLDSNGFWFFDLFCARGLIDRGSLAEFVKKQNNNNIMIFFGPLEDPPLELLENIRNNVIIKDIIE